MWRIQLCLGKHHRPETPYSTQFGPCFLSAGPKVVLFFVFFLCFVFLIFLSVLFSVVTFFFLHDNQSHHWLWWAQRKKRKKMDSRIKFEQVDISSLSTRKKRTYVSDWPLSLTHTLFLWEVFPHLPLFSPKVSYCSDFSETGVTCYTTSRLSTTEEHKQTSQLEPLCSESQFLSG